MTRLVIVDNDSGVDDIWALHILLNASDINVLAVTCVNGNTSVENVCKNNLYYLSTVGRCEIPVFKGAASQLIPPNYFGVSEEIQNFYGVNGFGDVPLPDINRSAKLRDENAIIALQRITSEHKGEVTILCCGPLTNIALAIRTYPDFAENVKDIFIMGGNYAAQGNTTMCAEFNFHSDPEAAFIVLSEMKNKAVILPWEACLTPKLTFDFRKQLGEHPNEALELLNKIEKPILERLQRFNFTHWISADTMLAAVFVDSELIEEKFSAHATVELSGLHTRGQLVIDHLHIREPNVVIIKSFKKNHYEDFLRAVVSQNVDACAIK